MGAFKMKTLIEKTLKNAAECSEKKNGEKIYLQDICVKNGYVMSTNSHILYKGRCNLLHTDGMISKDNAKKGKPIFYSGIASNYPDLDRLIPTDYKYIIKDILVNDLLPDAEALKAFNKRRKAPLKLTIDPENGFIYLSSFFDYGAEQIKVAQQAQILGPKQPYKIGINPSLLVKALKGFEAIDSVDISFSASNLQPLKISNKEQLYIIAPCEL